MKFYSFINKYDKLASEMSCENLINVIIEQTDWKFYDIINYIDEHYLEYNSLRELLFELMELNGILE